MEDTQDSTVAEGLRMIRDHADAIYAALSNQMHQDLIAILRGVDSTQADRNILGDTGILDIVKKLNDHDSVVVSTVAKELCGDQQKHEESQEQKLTPAGAGPVGVLPTQASETIPSDTTSTTSTHDPVYHEQEIDPFPASLGHYIRSSERPVQPRLLSLIKAYKLYGKNAHDESLAAIASIESLENLLTWANDSGRIGANTLERLHGDVKTLKKFAQISANELEQWAGLYRDAIFVFMRVLTDVQEQDKDYTLLRKHVKFRESFYSSMEEAFLHHKSGDWRIRNLMRHIFKEMVDLKNKSDDAHRAWIINTEQVVLNAREKELTFRKEFEKQLHEYRTDRLYCATLIPSLKARIDTMKDEMANQVSQEKYHTLEAQLQAQRSKALTAQQEVEKFSIELSNLKAKLDEAEKNTDAHKKIKELESQLRDKDVMLQNRNVTIEDLRAKVRDKNPHHQQEQARQEEINRLRDDIHDIETELTKATEELKRMREENEALKKNTPRQQITFQEPILVKPWLAGGPDGSHLRVLLKKTEDDLLQTNNKKEQVIKQRKQLEEEHEQHKKDMALLEEKMAALGPGGGRKNSNKGKIKLDLGTQDSHDSQNSQAQDPSSESGVTPLEPAEAFPLLGRTTILQPTVRQTSEDFPQLGRKVSTQPTEDFPPLGFPVKKADAATKKVSQNIPPSTATNQLAQSMEDFPPLGGTVIKKKWGVQNQALPPNQINEEEPTSTANYANAAAKGPAPGVFKIVKYGQSREQEKRK